MKKLKMLLKDDSGQGMLEYVLLVGVLAIIIVAFKGQITNMVNNWTGKVDAEGNKVFGGP
jgi:Flp pilus assembly pilin Flp